MAYKTIGQLALEARDKFGERPAVMQKYDGAYKTFKWIDILDMNVGFAAALNSLGLKKGDRVAILSDNRIEWLATDGAIMCTGLISVPVYMTLTPAQIKYILEDSGASAIFVDTQEQLKKVLEVKDSLPNLKHIVVLTEDLAKDGRLLWRDLMEKGKARRDALDLYRQLAAAVDPEDVATIVYTSGTTGNPKGVMLTHKNFTSNAEAVVPISDITCDDLFLSFLPLSHVFARIGTITGLIAGYSVAFAESVNTIRDDMGVVKPTVIPSVPRLFEKMHTAILENVSAQSPLKQKIFHWAVKVGLEYRKATEDINIIAPETLKLKYKIADKLVLSKIRDVTGGRVRFCVSGGAPLSLDIAEFFYACGIKILEGYGLTETSPLITYNAPGRFKFGTVGRTIKEVEVKIASDGEILARGPNIMKGYYNNPDATAEAIEKDGWFHTGDIGRFDNEGFLKITDRKKNIIVMSNGKNVAPAPIEGALIADQFIEQAVLIGDNRNFMTALVVPAFERLEAWAKENGVPGDRTAIVASPKTVEFYAGLIKELTVDFARFEQVKKFRLLDRELTQESGELTPTLKVKRNVVLEKFKDIVDEMYSN